MDSNSVSADKQLTAQTTKETAASTRPRAPSTAGMSSIFTNAQNIKINNSTFVTNIQVGSAPSLDVLYNRVAPNAILNAGGRADEVRCHPGTREEVIGCMEMWRADAQDGITASRMFWLSGPAGAGKTAIVQTVAESWTSRGLHTANFFFFRTDTSRSNAHSLVSTLLYQLFDFHLAVRGAVEKALAARPRILEASIEEQFEELICVPFRSIEQSFSESIVLLIDGFDECDSEQTSQLQILHALDRLVSQNDLPFLVLVASRVEHQITMAFNQLSSSVASIFLDDQYLPQKDIRRFVTAEFDKIRTTHPLAHILDKEWPSPSDVDDIVAKSSGQFIYAATVMHFISDSSTHPQLSLLRVRGAAPIAKQSPFFHVDAMYSSILSRAYDQQSLKDILHAHFLVPQGEHSPRGSLTLQWILGAYDHRYTKFKIQLSIADVAAIARFEDEKLIFYHASLGDYFLDQSRSQEYFVDTRAFSVKLQPRLLNHAKKNENDRKLAYECLARLKPIVQDSERRVVMDQIELLYGDIRQDLDIVVDSLRSKSASDVQELASWVQNLLHCIYEKYYPDHLDTYKQLLKQWIFWAFSNKVPLGGRQSLPYARWYLLQTMIEN